MRKMIMFSATLLPVALLLFFTATADAHTGSATATCGSVTLNWSDFDSSGSNNNGENSPDWTITFTPSDGGATYTVSGTETFSGSSATLTEAIPDENGTVVASSSWTGAQTRDGLASSFSDTIPVSSCASFSVIKEQQIAGAGTSFTTAPLSGTVGQTVNYQIAVVNTGSVSLSLVFADAGCDAGTVIGPIGTQNGSLDPSGTAYYYCSHLLSAANEPQYTNTATVDGTPPSGPTTTTPSNTVVVNISPPVVKVKAVCVVNRSKVALLSHTGNTHEPFWLRVSSFGVARVRFWLDGHVLSTLTSNKAHAGYISTKVNPLSLPIGAHHVKVRITLKDTDCAAITRKLVFVRARPAATVPTFTG